jgi:hypothetical protein
LTPGDPSPSRLQRASGWACLTLWIAATAWVLVLGVARPVRNFDLIDYVALALEWVEDDPEVVHRRTYEILAAELPPAVFADLSAGDEYRRAIRDDWRLFDANLGFHRGRYLYSLAVLAAHQVGVPLTSATWLVNQVCWAAAAVVILLWARRRFDLASASLLALGVVLSPPVIALLPASSTESMALLVVTLGLYLLVERRAFRSAAVALALTILVRPEFLLVCLGVIAGLFVLARPPDRPGTRFLALWAGACTGLWVLVAATARDPGWWAVFTSPLRRVGDLDRVYPFSPRAYAFVLDLKLEPLLYLGYDISPGGTFVRGSGFLFTYLCAAAFGVLLVLRTRVAELGVHAAVLAGIVAATLARLVLFPYFWDRYFVYLWVPGPLVLASLAALLAERARGAASERA